MTYFGNSDISGSWGNNNAGNAFGSLYTCPGVGVFEVESLEAYLNGGGHVRMAIYSSDLSTLICQGSAQISLGAVGWYSHTSFVDIDGNPITPYLTGGVDYYLVHCYDSNWGYQRYQISGSHKYKVGGSDYTDSGYPEPLSLPSTWSVRHSIRCGISDNPVATTLAPTTTLPTTVSSTTLAPTTAPPLGTICWGHDTGVTEDNKFPFLGHWAGIAVISGVGDAEKFDFDLAEFEESESWHIGIHRVKIQINKYIGGTGVPTIKYKNGSTLANCNADTWHNYVAPFNCLGWVKVRLET